MQESGVQSLGQEDPLAKEIPISVFLLEKSQGQRSLVGCSPRVEKSWHDLTTKQQNVSHWRQETPWLQSQCSPTFRTGGSSDSCSACSIQVWHHWNGSESHVGKNSVRSAQLATQEQGKACEFFFSFFTERKTRIFWFVTVLVLASVIMGHIVRCSKHFKTQSKLCVFPYFTGYQQIPYDISSQTLIIYHICIAYLST